MRVPPSQSTTSAAARVSAASGSEPSSWRVTRVSRVPKQNASQRLSERSAACANMTSARE